MATIRTEPIIKWQDGQTPQTGTLALGSTFKKEYLELYQNDKILEKNYKEADAVHYDYVLNYAGIEHVPNRAYPIYSQVRFYWGQYGNEKEVPAGSGSFIDQFHAGYWKEVDDIKVGWFVFGNNLKNDHFRYVHATGWHNTVEQVKAWAPVLYAKMQRGLIPIKGTWEHGDNRGFFRRNGDLNNPQTTIFFPNLQNIFFRGVGEKSIGEYEGDAIRNIMGTIEGTKGSYSNAYDWGFGGSSGAFQSFNRYTAVNRYGGGSYYMYNNFLKLDFSTSRVVPTAHENRPVNIRQNILIKFM